MISKLPSERLLRQALRHGGDFADLFFEKTTRTTITAENNKIETLLTGTDQGLGLRVVADGRTSLASSNALDRKSLEALSETVSNSVRHGTPIKPKPLKKILKGDAAQYVREDPLQIPLDRKLKLVEEMNRFAWKLNPKIAQVQITYADLRRETEIAGSNGIHVINPQILTLFAATITVGDGQQLTTGYDSLGGFQGYELLESQEALEGLIQKALFRALLNLRADRAQGGSMPVVISSEAGGTLVHEAVGHGLEADLATQGLSVYEDQIGETVASPLLTIVDDPTLPGKRGSYFFDDEGTPSQKTVLIEKGVLKTYLNDRIHAAKTQSEPNGHGRRESYEYKPIVRMANTMILPGTDDPESILRSVDRGLFVKMMGGGQVNTVNGDFVFEVTEGYRIENGRIGEPVRGATLTGSGPEILKIIDRVGSDLGFSIGTCGKDGQGVPVTDAMPTIRIPEMVVGGVTE